VKRDQQRRFLERMAREAARDRLDRARKAVKAARVHKRGSVARARALCKHARESFTAWKRDARGKLKTEIAALRKQAREWPKAQRALLKGEIARRTADVCEVCSHVGGARKKGAADLEQARAGLVSERQARKRERIWAGPPARSKLYAGPALGKGAARVREIRDESDHEVEVNLTPDELIVWHRVKTQIRKGERMTRTEAFHHWMHDHSADVARLLEEDAAEALRAHEKELARLERNAITSAKLQRKTDAELAAVINESVPALAMASGDRSQGEGIRGNARNSYTPPPRLSVVPSAPREAQPTKREKRPKAPKAVPPPELPRALKASHKLAAVPLLKLEERLRIVDDLGGLDWSTQGKSGHGKYWRADTGPHAVAIDSFEHVQLYQRGRSLDLGNVDGLTGRELLKRLHLASMLEREYQPDDAKIPLTKVGDLKNGVRAGNVKSPRYESLTLDKYHEGTYQPKGSSQIQDPWRITPRGGDLFLYAERDASRGERAKSVRLGHVHDLYVPQVMARARYVHTSGGREPDEVTPHYPSQAQLEDPDNQRAFAFDRLAALFRRWERNDASAWEALKELTPEAKWFELRALMDELADPGEKAARVQRWQVEADPVPF
jgi:hypothetical protein